MAISILIKIAQKIKQGEWIHEEMPRVRKTEQ